MTLADNNLVEVLAQLSDLERKAVDAQLRGVRTPAGWAALRKLRRRLKGRARARRSERTQGRRA